MLKILLSADAADKHATDIARLLGDAEHALVIADKVSPGTAFDIAFLTREVTGSSSKRHLAPATRHYYELLQASQPLRWLHIHSAGADRPVFVDLKQRGVQITTSSGANAGPVAHSVLAGMLSLARRFPQFQAAQRERRWDQRFDAGLPKDVRRQTAMIVGWGPVGQEVGRLLRAIGMRCIAVRRAPHPSSDAQLQVIAASRFKEHLHQVDWLILACPLTEDTRHLVDADALSLLPHGARLVNVARGEVVVQDDVIKALQSGQLGGAFLDVTDPEPLPCESPLWAFDNVILTPHTAGHADTNAEAVLSMFLDNLALWQAGAVLNNRVP